MFVHKEPDIRTWKEELLKGTNPLFKRINKTSAIPGPHAITNGQIVGNLFAMEQFHFYSYATQEQKEYYDHLKETDLPRAYEYLLTITDSIDIWKQDIKIIEYIKEGLTMEENDLDTQLKNLKQNLEKEQIKRIPSVLKKHIPEHIFDVDLNDAQSIAKLAEKEKSLTDYLKKVHKEMPFLFDNSR